MNNARHNDEDQFTAQLLAHDAAILEGSPRGGDPSEDRDLREAKACLDELETIWPRRERTPPATQAPLVTLGESLCPVKLGRFEVIRELGRGGGGIVYLGYDPTLHRQVALKIPRPESLFSPDLRRRFVREAEVAAQLSHAHIIPVHEAGEADGVCYLVSAYCPGPNLGVWARGRNVSPRLAALIVAALADGVAHMHGRGILHRDIKPTNVLLEFDARAAGGELEFVPRLTDFGLAKLDALPGALPHADTPGRPAPDRMTYTGAVIGTPAYMAPEQAEGRLELIGMATDVYALGVVLYELLAGQPPFRADTDVATLQQIVGAEPRRLRGLRRDVPRDLEAACLKCLEKAPAARYASAQELGWDLRNFLEGKPTAARPLPAARRALKWAKRRPALAASGLSMALAVAAVMGGLIHHTIQQDRHNVELTKINAQLTETAQREHDQRTRAEGREDQLQLTSYADRFEKAWGAFREGKVVQAVEWLNELAPGPGDKDLRGFEWHYLKGLCHPLEGVWRGHVGELYCVAVSPDGKQAASGAKDHTVRLWDVATGREHAVIRGHARAPTSVAFSPDGRTVASVSDVDKKGWLQLFDVDQGKARAMLEFGLTDHCELAFSQKGTTIAVSTRFGFGFYDAVTGEKLGFYPVTDCHPWSIAFAPDGRTVATGNDDGTVRLWDAATGREQARLSGHKENVASVAFSADGQTLASGSWDTTARLWKVSERATIAVLPHRDKVKCVAFSGDGRLATTALYNTSEPKLWDAATGQHLLTMDRTLAEPRVAAFVPGRPLLVVGCEDRTVRLLRTDGPPAAKQLPGHAPKETWSLAFMPDGGTLVSGGDDSHVRLWDMAAGEPRILTAHKSLVTAVVCARDGSTFASAGYDEKVTLFDAKTRLSTRTMTTPGQKLRCLALSPNGKIIAAGTRSNTPMVFAWDVSTGRELLAFAHDHHVLSVAFSPTKPLLVSAGDEGKIRWWDTATWQFLGHSDATERVNCVAFAPDGQTLASGSVSGEVHLWDVATKHSKAVLRGHERQVFALTYSPDGRTLCSAGEDRTVRLWQAATGRQLAILEGHVTRVNAVAFTLDSRTLASAGHDGIIKMWPSVSKPRTPVTK